MREQRNRLDERMMAAVVSSIKAAEAIIAVVDAGGRGAGAPALRAHPLHPPSLRICIRPLPYPREGTPPRTHAHAPPPSRPPADDPQDALGMFQPGPDWSGPPMGVLLNKADLVAPEALKELEAWYRDNCR